LEVLNGLREEVESEKLEKLIDDLSEHWQRLGHIENSTDQVEKFFSEYSPERLHKRVLLENALDAQGDKLLNRYSIEQERRALRKKTEVSPTAQSQSVKETAASMEKIVDCLSGEAGGEFDLTELDREDSDTPSTRAVLDDDDDEWASPKA
jgi:hypothetical protein